MRLFISLVCLFSRCAHQVSLCMLCIQRTQKDTCAHQENNTPTKYRNSSLCLFICLFMNSSGLYLYILITSLRQRLSMLHYFFFHSRNKSISNIRKLKASSKSSFRRSFFLFLVLKLRHPQLCMEDMKHELPRIYDGRINLGEQ
jgi:hypothetical protein